MDRYEIGCSACHLLAYRDTLADALRAATSYQFVHSNHKVWVYDRMAHHGRPQTWDVFGAVVSVRP